jgi:peptidoglycan L-alanyl-D-glutamate endopeptidase CwlK
MFKLSRRSLSNLQGVHPSLVAVVKHAITITKVDFGVIEGVRSVETQRRYVETGKSMTMNSRHLTGHAVDLMAFIDGKGCWELNVYDEVADAMKQAAIEHNVGIRWGAAWNVPDIRFWPESMEAALNFYIAERRKQNKRVFIDAPHFEMT